MQQLKDMLADRDAAIASQQLRINALSMHGKSDNASESEGSDVEQKLRAQLKTIMDDNRLLNAELDRNAVELGKLEHRLARGEYNAGLTKVRPSSCFQS